MTELADEIDEAIARRLARETSIYDDYDPLLTALDQLEALRDVPYPDAITEAQGRRVFLAQAREVLAPSRARSAWGWSLPFGKFKQIFRLNTFARIGLALGLALALVIFGAGGLAAYAAQSSLPNEPLYTLKLAIEDARLALSPDAAANVALSGEFAAQRVGEMTRLVSAAQPIPPELVTRLDVHLARALQTAAGMAQPQAALRQFQQMTMAQGSRVAQALRASPQNPELEQAAQALEIASGMAGAGMLDPNQFRQQMKGGLNGMPGMKNPASPAIAPGATPAGMPSTMPTSMPSSMPTPMPAMFPTMLPSAMPPVMPTSMPVAMPTSMMMPTSLPTMMPAAQPSAMPATMMPGGGGGMGGGKP